MNGSGYADLLAKGVAGADWILADAAGEEPIDPAAWATVQEFLPSWVDSPGRVARGDPACLRRLVAGLMMSGFAMQAAGTSRLASGADRQFSHLWDMQHHTHDGAAPSHGFKVGIGTLASLGLYELLLAGTWLGSTSRPRSRTGRRRSGSRCESRRCSERGSSPRRRGRRPGRSTRPPTSCVRNSFDFAPDGPRSASGWPGTCGRSRTPVQCCTRPAARPSRSRSGSPGIAATELRGGLLYPASLHGPRFRDAPRRLRVGAGRAVRTGRSLVPRREPLMSIDGEERPTDLGRIHLVALDMDGTIYRGKVAARRCGASSRADRRRRRWV